jgi:hypothetical protein
VLGAKTRQRVPGLGIGRVERRQRHEPLVELSPTDDTSMAITSTPIGLRDRDDPVTLRVLAVDDQRQTVVERRPVEVDERHAELLASAWLTSSSVTKFSWRRASPRRSRSSSDGRARSEAGTR